MLQTTLGRRHDNQRLYIFLNVQQPCTRADCLLVQFQFDLCVRQEQNTLLDEQVNLGLEDLELLGQLLPLGRILTLDESLDTPLEVVFPIGALRLLQQLFWSVEVQHVSVVAGAQLDGATSLQLFLGNLVTSSNLLRLLLLLVEIGCAAVGWLVGARISARLLRLYLLGRDWLGCGFWLSGVCLVRVCGKASVGQVRHFDVGRFRSRHIYLFAYYIIIDRTPYNRQ